MILFNAMNNHEHRLVFVPVRGECFVNPALPVADGSVLQSALCGACVIFIILSLNKHLKSTSIHAVIAYGAFRPFLQYHKIIILRQRNISPDLDIGFTGNTIYSD